MSTLVVVEEILRETRVPMSVRQIVEYSAGRLPTRSKTPDTVVARDLSMDIKRNGEASKFVRTSPGRYTLRAVWQEIQARAEDLPGNDNGQNATVGSREAIGEPAEVARPTDVLAALRSGRAGPLPAKSSPVVREQEKGSHNR